MDVTIGALIILGLVIIFVLGRLFYKLINTISNLKIKNAALNDNNIVLDNTAKELLDQQIELETKYIETSSKLDKTTHQKKSSEVRLGKIGENLAPFTEGWPWEPNDFRFLGSPIDGMQFTEDRIYLVEIKTGKARLSKKQARCRELVKQGKISFVSYRIDTEGHTLLETPALSE